MFKLSFFILLLSTPFLSATIYYGLPLWVYASLGATFLYAGVLIYIIEKKYKSLKEKHE